MVKDEMQSEFSLFDQIPMLIAGAVFIFPVFGYLLCRKLVLHNNFLLKKYSYESRKKFMLYIIPLLLLLSAVIILVSSKTTYLILINLAVPIILLSAGFCFLFAEVIFKKHLNFKLEERHISKRPMNFDNLGEFLNKKEVTPIGISLITNKPILLDNNIRNEHLMISGKSGAGKSSLAISLRRSDLKWNRPIIDIDPKGDNEDINIIKKFAKFYGREADFFHFNINDAECRYTYNFLELGNAKAKVDKILFALDLDHDHYGGIQSNVLSTLFEVAEVLEIDLTLDSLSNLLSSKEKVASFFEKFNSRPTNDEYSHLHVKINAYHKIKYDSISGLVEKISDLNSGHLRGLLNPSDEKINISLNEIIKNNKIAYFQLNSNEYKRVKRIIGRFILSDLEIVSGQIYNDKLPLDTDFIPVYIDEFISFASRDFFLFLNTARSAKMGITFLFQSISGIDAHDEHMKHELVTNTGYSVHFQANSSADCEYITLVPGTTKVRQRSFGVGVQTGISNYSGKGTEFLSEEKRIESNIPRILKKGQCLFFNKHNNDYEVIEIWHGKKEADTLFQDTKKYSRKSLWTMEEAEALMLSPAERLRIFSYDMNKVVKSKL